jgi:hypothetical protein
MRKMMPSHMSDAMSILPEKEIRRFSAIFPVPVFFRNPLSCPFKYSSLFPLPLSFYLRGIGDFEKKRARA